MAAKASLRDVDRDCLDLLNLHHALSPISLARQAGIHPATLTGVLDRLERAGWVTRQPDPADRRGVVLRVQRQRGGEMLRLYAGMSHRIDQLLAGYRSQELAVIDDFLHRVAEAGQAAAGALHQAPPTPRPKLERSAR